MPRQQTQCDKCADESCLDCRQRKAKREWWHRNKGTIAARKRYVAVLQRKAA